jgi:hypothetical protein
MHYAAPAECLATGTDVQTLQVTTGFLTPRTQKQSSYIIFLFPMQLTLITKLNNHTYIQPKHFYWLCRQTKAIYFALKNTNKK